MKKIYNIKGMHCASCALTIENKLNKMSGIKAANVNFATQQATVEFAADKSLSDEASSLSDGVIKAVKAAGYEASIEDENSGGHDHGAAVKEAEIKKERNQFILSLVLSLPVLVLSMILRDASFQSKVIQSLLAGVVQFYVGFRFYRGTYYAAKNKTANMDTLIAGGTSAAYFYSIATTYFIKGEVFYETAALLVTFVVLGKWLEARAKGKAGEAIKKLLGLQAKTARILRTKTQKHENTPPIAGQAENA